MAHEPLEERQVEFTEDGGVTWKYFHTYPTIREACAAIPVLWRHGGGKSYRRKSQRLRPTHNADGTPAL
jgi:hypothetical protein